MATPNYAPGYPGQVTFQPTTSVSPGAFPGGTNTVLNVQGWDWMEEVGDLDTTSSGSGGIEERIAGILRGKGSFQAVYDLANKHHKDPPRIRAGAKGMMRFYETASTYYIVPVMILSVPVKSVVAGKIEYTCNVGLDNSAATAVSPNVYTYPG